MTPDIRCGSPDPDKTDFSALKNMPMLWVWGDYIGDTSFWKSIVARQETVRAQVNKLGGMAEVMLLPALGVKGNSHMIMMDKNLNCIAGMISDGLMAHGLVR